MVAQWLEQRTHNPLVTGSSPVRRTTLGSVTQLVRVSDF